MIEIQSYTCVITAFSRLPPEICARSTVERDRRAESPALDFSRARMIRCDFQSACDVKIVQSLGLWTFSGRNANTQRGAQKQVGSRRSLFACSRGVDLRDSLQQQFNHNLVYYCAEENRSKRPGEFTRALEQSRRVITVERGIFGQIYYQIQVRHI